MKVKTFGLVLLLGLLNVGVRAAALPEEKPAAQARLKVVVDVSSAGGYHLKVFTVDGPDGESLIGDRTSFIVSGSGSAVLMRECDWSKGKDNHIKSYAINLNILSIEPLEANYFATDFTVNETVFTGWKYENGSTHQAMRGLETIAPDLIKDRNDRINWLSTDELIRVENGNDGLINRNPCVYRLLQEKVDEAENIIKKRESLVEILKEKGLAVNYSLTDCHYISANGEWFVGVGRKKDTGGSCAWIVRIPRDHDN